LRTLGVPGCAILSMTGGDAGGLHRTLQTIPPHLLSTPWILAGAIRGIPGIGGLPARETGIRGAKPCSLAIRDAVAVPCSNGIVPYDTPPSTYVCTVLPDPVSLIFSGVHPCVAAGTLQPPGQVIHDRSGRAWPFQRIAGLPVRSGYLCHNVQEYEHGQSDRI